MIISFFTTLDLHVADLAVLAVNGIKNFREERFEKFEKVLGTKLLRGVGVNRICALEERAR